MGTSRRQRSKAEGTFLECVRDLLKDISREVASIKVAVEHIQGSRSYVNQPHDIASSKTMFASQSHDWCTWYYWEPISADILPNVKTHVNTDDCTSARASLSEELYTFPGPSEFDQACVISKAVMLKYRDNVIRDHRAPIDDMSTLPRKAVTSTVMPNEQTGTTMSLAQSGQMKQDVSDEAESILARGRAAESHAEEMAAVTDSLRWAMAQLEGALKEIPQELVTKRLCAPMRTLRNSWSCFSAKPLETRTTQEGKHLMTLVMGVQTEISQVIRETALI